jgi:hypothetical protein
MSKPHYPTKQAIWSKGKRKEKGFQGARLGLPYKEAVKQFQKASKGRKDFDAATLFVWGTMQATAVLNILKAAEDAYGEAGQEMVRKGLNRAGYEAMDGMLRNSHFPASMSEIDMISYALTGLNTILYASLEKPWVVSKDRCEFDILWCPHQDLYTAFDCRVQRFFVEGMLEAMKDHGMGGFTAWVEELIPRGAQCCHFVVERVKEGNGRNPWHKYSDHLSRRALEKLKKE